MPDARVKEVRPTAQKIAHDLTRVMDHVVNDLVQHAAIGCKMERIQRAAIGMGSWLGNMVSGEGLEEPSWAVLENRRVREDKVLVSLLVCKRLLKRKEFQLFFLPIVANLPQRSLGCILGKTSLLLKMRNTRTNCLGVW